MTTVVHTTGGRGLARMTEAFPDVEFVDLSGHSDDGLGDLDRADVLFVSGADPTRLPALLALPVRWIHQMDTGVDRFPLELVGDRVLTCGRGANADAIAEWVLAVILADAKRLPESWIDQPPDRWYVGSSVRVGGATVAILGFGAIGRAVARRALALDMHVRVLRRSSTPTDLPGVEQVADLRTLCDGAEHVVIAAPLTPDLRHVLDDAAFAHVGPDAHLVNVSRGGHIDQDALRRALDAGRVRRASLDVCDPEPLPAGHWLYDDPRVRLSPHVSWHEPEATRRLFDVFAANLRRFLDGRPLEGVVDTEAGY